MTLHWDHFDAFHRHRAPAHGLVGQQPIGLVAGFEQHQPAGKARRLDLIFCGLFVGFAHLFQIRGKRVAQLVILVLLP
jgi:hypothetical protein